jgi:predicted transcriptional regulator
MRLVPLLEMQELISQKRGRYNRKILNLTPKGKIALEKLKELRKMMGVKY